MFKKFSEKKLRSQFSSLKKIFFFPEKKKNFTRKTQKRETFHRQWYLRKAFDTVKSPLSIVSAFHRVRSKRIENSQRICINRVTICISGWNEVTFFLHFCARQSQTLFQFASRKRRSIFKDLFHWKFQVIVCTTYEEAEVQFLRVPTLLQELSNLEKKNFFFFF